MLILLISIGIILMILIWSCISIVPKKMEEDKEQKEFLQKWYQKQNR